MWRLGDGPGREMDKKGVQLFRAIPLLDSESGRIYCITTTLNSHRLAATERCNIMSSPFDVQILVNHGIPGPVISPF